VSDQNWEKIPRDELNQMSPKERQVATYIAMTPKLLYDPRGDLSDIVNVFDNVRDVSLHLQNSILKDYDIIKEPTISTPVFLALGRYDYVSPYILGLIELKKKDYRQAADLFGRACSRLDFETKRNLEQASYFDNLARALYESGDLIKARNTYEKITLLTSGRSMDGDIYAKAFYMLGKIAEQQGDKARASQNYRKFLGLWKDADPGLAEVADGRKRLAGLK
jgi:tetratricopeptide (TPR) repeat protein